MKNSSLEIRVSRRGSDVRGKIKLNKGFNRE